MESQARNGSPVSFVQGKVDLEDGESTGIQTVLELIEHNALYNPGHAFCIQAQKQAEAPGLKIQTVSHLRLKRSIAGCQAWFLRTVTEIETADVLDEGKVERGKPVALLVESDIGLLIHLFSLMGLGVPVLLLSARLSPTAIHHLLTKTDACALVASPRLTNVAKDALSLFTTGDQQPSLYAQAAYTLFTDPSNGENSLEASICRPGYFVGRNDRNVLILHSSGTTGLPKPIYQSHTWLLGFTKCHELYGEDETLGLNLSTLPLYHGYGLVTPALSLGIGKTLCIPPPSMVPTGALVIDLLKLSKARSLISVPSILEGITTMPDEEGLKALSSLQFVAFGGGLLKRSVGAKLVASGVKVLNHYGSTESGPIAPFFVPEPGYDWNYFRIRRDLRMKMEPGSSPADGVQSYTLTMRPLGWESDFVFQDQLISNPLRPDTDFSAVGRTDDLIVLANGEKVVPHILESALFEDENVKAAIAFGDGQFELGVIVQPFVAIGAEEQEGFKSLIWPTIHQSMGKMDAHARITSNDAVLVIPHDTVLPRSDKGSVMRREVYKLFASEIAATYETLDKRSADMETIPLDMDNLEHELKDMIQTRLAWTTKAEDWTFDDDLFELGMDSLQATQLRRHILQSLPDITSDAAIERVPLDIVYQNPTVADLARSLKTSCKVSAEQSIVDDFVEQFKIKPKTEEQASSRGAVVLLTGGTGSLGSHLLAQLASLPSVDRVLCINRPSANPDAHQRQLQAFQARKVDITQQALDKIKIFQSTASFPLLGLSEAEYAQVKDQVTHIIHNAWPMDFKRALPSFKSQFQMLRNLLQLARDAHHVHPLTRPKLIFISSIAVVGQYPRLQEDAMIPEIPMRDQRCANDIGYAKAKLTCERIIESAAQDLASEMEVAYVRIGQMSGSKQSGNWNTDEHLAALFKSGQTVGSLPSLPGTLSWIPVDIAAATITDILLCNKSSQMVYHLENPVRQSWNDILHLVAAELHMPPSEFIPFDQWMNKVCTASAAADEDLPVKKLEGFFRADFEHMACGDVILDTKNARDVSPTLRRLGRLSRDTLVSYIDYWKSIGYLK